MWWRLRRAASRFATEFDAVLFLTAIVLADLGLSRTASRLAGPEAIPGFPPEWRTPSPRRRPGGSLWHETRRAGLPLSVGLVGRASGATRLGHAAKRLIDIVAASLGLLLLAPLFLACIVAIRLDTPGPALFRQRRSGRDGRPFTIYKFRTMTVMEDGPVIVQATAADPRLTRLGALLRRSSIDELPQLFNVLRGEMSLVGPRPHAVAHDALYGASIARYALRYRMRPGITGWAQVHGLRGETRRMRQMVCRVAHDVWYVNNWSLALDLRILLSTCRMLFRAAPPRRRARTD